MFEIPGKYTTAKVMIDDVEESCISQIYGFVNHNAFTNPITIMPDTHAGKGSVIGFTMKMTDKVIPNVIGVDIGCGMLSFNIGNDELPVTLEQLDAQIRNRVPFGFAVNDNCPIDFVNEFPWKEINKNIHNFTLAYNKEFNTNFKPKKIDARGFVEHCNEMGANPGRIKQSIGSLGGGNHFIEVGVCDQTNKNIWITIHTGSRNYGKQVCDYWQRKAIHDLKVTKKEAYNKRIAEIRDKYTGMEVKKQIKKAREEMGLNDTKTNDELCYLEGEDAYGYLVDMLVAQVYADVNRRCIMDAILGILGLEKAIDEVQTIHNFIDFRDFIVRKGSVRAYKGERFVLPFNMRDGILICEGKSNREWNCSAPHGAGRVLSRSQAKKQLDVDDFKKQMKGIYSTSVGYGTLDEAPGAYKDADVIEKAIEPTAKIFFKIKPIHNMKDKDGKG